jgi:hypothetical protein
MIQTTEMDTILLVSSQKRIHSTLRFLTVTLLKKERKHPHHKRFLGQKTLLLTQYIRNIIHSLTNCKVWQVSILLQEHMDPYH